jgi:hypothetical protein
MCTKFPRYADRLKEATMLLDFLFFAGQVLNLAALAYGAYLMLSYGRKKSIAKAVEKTRFAEFDAFQ